jgi:hypothetical protein
MEKIIKAIWEHCKSSFINWVITNIWKLFDFGGVITIISTLALIQEIPSFYWVPTVLLTCYLFIAVVNGFAYWYNYFQKPVLEIIYDDGKFNQESVLYDCSYPRKIFACVIGICNKSTKTVRSVKVFMETEGNPQITLLNFNTNKITCDINPGATELFKVGELTGNFTNTKIKIIASGDNILPSEKEITL